MNATLSGAVRQLRAVWILVLVALGLYIATPLFLTAPNMLNVLLAVSITGLAAVAQTYVIILAEIDLSVGAVLGLAGVISAMLLRPYGVVVALVAGLLVGLGAGLINGILVTKFRMPSFIVTLAMMMALSGTTLWLTQGNPVRIDDPLYSAIGRSRPLDVPAPVWIVVVAFVVFGLLLARTRFGRYVYATGDNIDAARLSGVNVARVKIIAFMMSGGLSAIAGFILAARLSAAQPTAGSGLELSVIAAVILGGTSLAGGRGTIIGTAIGAFLLGIIDNGLNLLDVSPFLQDVVKGIVILLAVFFDRNSELVSHLVGALRFPRRKPGAQGPAPASSEIPAPDPRIISAR